MRLDVDFHIVGVVLIVVLPLVVSQPAGLHKFDPAIVAKHGTNERFHLLRHDLASAQVPRDLIEQGVVLIDLCPQLVLIVVFGVDGAELGPDADGPV